MTMTSSELIDQTISEVIKTERSEYTVIDNLSFKSKVSTIPPRLVVTLVDSGRSEIEPVPLNPYQYKLRINSLLKILLRTQLKTSFQNVEKLNLVYEFELMKVQLIKQLESLLEQLSKIMALDKELGRRRKNNLRLKGVIKQPVRLSNIKNNLNKQKGLLKLREISNNECYCISYKECHTKNKCHTKSECHHVKNEYHNTKDEYMLPEEYNGDILSRMRLDDVDVGIFDLIPD